MLTAEEDFSIADIDTIPDEEMPPTQKEMARSLIRRFGHRVSEERSPIFASSMLMPARYVAPRWRCWGKAKDASRCDNSSASPTRRLDP